MTGSSSTVVPSAVPYSIDVAVFACHDGRLTVLAARPPRARAAVLPWSVPARGEPLVDVARRAVRDALGVSPAWIEQGGAIGDGTEHPSHAMLSVWYCAAVPYRNVAPPWAWVDVRAGTMLTARQRKIRSSALTTVRSRIELAPVAFSFLPRQFTLAELQRTYEVILGRSLHKASFRRALHAAFVVEPTGEWRLEGRGRPAQLFRHATHRAKRARRGVRMDLL